MKQESFYLSGAKEITDRAETGQVICLLSVITESKQVIYYLFLLVSGLPNACSSIFLF